MIALVLLCAAIASGLLFASVWLASGERRSSEAPPTGSSSNSTGSDAVVSAAAARDLLAALEVRVHESVAVYRRDAFGEAWLDVDGNGCDTRNDVLARDLASTVRSGGCRVLSGTLLDPYTGDVVEFVRGEATSPLVQVDHIVSLSNAWRTGAQALDAQERIAFANDPRNLLAVSGVINQAKGSSDASEWLPPDEGARCR